MNTAAKILSLVVCAAVFVIGGCSLTLGVPINAVTPTLDPAVVADRSAPVFIDARTLPDDSSQSPQAASASSSQPQSQSQSQSQTVIIQQPVYVIQPNCAPRYDWGIYVVRYGDTLARIAASYGTSVATLAYANCIADPNRIYVGQYLRVPYYAPPPNPHPYPYPYPNPHPHPYPYPTWTPAAVPTQTPLPPIVIGTGLTFSSYAEVNNNVFTLNPDELITISWIGTFPSATRQVAFEVISPLGGAQVVGIDSNLGDGASILYHAVPGTQGNFRAVASFYGSYPGQSSDWYYIIVPG